MQKIFLFCLMGIFCVSCDSNSTVTDLKDFIDHTYNQKIEVSTDIYKPPSYQLSLFSPSINENPFFTSFELQVKDRVSNCSSAENIPKPELLQTEQISDLFLKGIIQEKENNWALIMASDKKIYRVKEGQIIGSNAGLIENIDKKTMSIAEFVQNETGCWQKQYKKLAMDG